MGSLAPRPCGTSLPSPAKGPVNGRATFRPLGSHTGRKPSRACAKEASFCSRRAPRRILRSEGETESGNGLQALRGSHFALYDNFRVRGCRVPRGAHMSIKRN